MADNVNLSRTVCTLQNLTALLDQRTHRVSRLSPPTRQALKFIYYLNDHQSDHNPRRPTWTSDITPGRDIRRLDLRRWGERGDSTTLHAHLGAGREGTQVRTTILPP